MYSVGKVPPGAQVPGNKQVLTHAPLYDVEVLDEWNTAVSILILWTKPRHAALVLINDTGIHTEVQEVMFGHGRHQVIIIMCLGQEPEYQ